MTIDEIGKLITSNTPAGAKSYRLVQEQSGKAVPNVIHRAPRAGDILHSCANTDRVQSVLQFAPEYSVMEGLRITVAN